MTFLLDENLSPRHADRLRTQGFDATAVSDLGLCAASDPVIRSSAIILRYPVDGTPGVIWLRLHPPTEAGIARALDRVLEKLGREDLDAKLVVVDEDKIRVRG